MNYLYYPGCSLKCSGRAYEESLLPVFQAVGASLEELPDWNCCGATSYMSVNQESAFSLALRNLCLAERHGGTDGAPVDMVAPCAACYLSLVKEQHHLTDHPQASQQMMERLATAGLHYTGRVRVRHPLDVLLNDVGLDAVRAQVRRPLLGLKVACYYGCLLVRPYAVFDHQFRPTTMDRLVSALGAQPVDWPLKTRCCGGTLTGTIPEVGLRLNELLLDEAKRRGADVIATACPLCQFNLECQESREAPREGGRGRLPILYFTQLVGLAFGIPERKLGLQRSLVPVQPALAALEGAHHA
jgi:heterodisulfide reductase subunit B